MTGAPHRQAAEQRGRRAEWLASWLLRFKGYRIIASRLQTPFGEIDLLAKRGRVVVVVEVKARASVSEALHAVSARQQQRLATAAAWLPAWRKSLEGADIRFDVVAVTPRSWPHHIPNAWVSA